MRVLAQGTFDSSVCEVGKMTTSEKLGGVLQELEDAIVDHGSLEIVEGIFQNLCAEEKLTILASTAATGGVSLLGLAAFGGREEIVKFLINVFEDRSSLQFELQKKLSEGFTPLWLAAVKGHLSIVELILDCFDTPEERYSCLCQRATSISKTSIDYAASEGNSDVIGYLLNQLDPRQRLGLLLQEDGYDRNPLMLATINGNASCIHALLDPLTPQEQAMYLKAANSSRSTPLLGAIQKAKTVSIDALLLHCTPDFTPADYIRSPIDEDCHTALHYAAEQPDKESLSVLLAHLSAEEDSLISCLEARSRLGYAALHSACRSKDGGPAALELLNTMHSLGLDTGSRTVFGETPLHLAAREGLSEVVQWYMTHAPQQFELRSHYGSTACELALMYRQDSLLSLLQEKGVIPQSEDPRLDPLYGAAPVAIGQTLLIDRLIRYLKASGWLTEDLLKSGTREQVPPGFSWDGETQRWDISGVCQGLSFLYAIDPSNGKEAFFKKLKAISLWDGSLESLALPVQGEEEFGNLGELMDQWINEVLWFQCDTDEGPEGLMAMSQQHMKERFDVVARREQHLVQEGPLRLDGVSTQGLLEVLEVLRFQVGKSVILIAEHTFGSLHAVVLTPLQGGGWSYYDSNMQHQLRDSLSTENVRDLLLAYFLPSEGRENIDLLVSILTYGNGPDRNIEQPDMPEKSACGWTALHVAQLIGSPKATEDLLQSADFSTDHLLARDAFGNTPLLLAIAMGAADKIRLQLSSVPKEICRQLLAQRNSRGITPLSLAAIWSDVACVEALLDCCAPEHRYEILCATNAFRNFGVQHCLVERSPDMAVSLYDTLTKYMNVEERKAWIQQEFEPGCTARTRARNNPALLERIKRDLLQNPHRLGTPPPSTRRM